MQPRKLHRYVSDDGPVIRAMLAAQALEAAENEGWPVPPPDARTLRTNGHRPFGWRKRALQLHH